MGNWTLTHAQRDWLEEHWQGMEYADRIGNQIYFDWLVTTLDYIHLFGAMSIDEAIDRYECWLEEHHG